MDIISDIDEGVIAFKIENGIFTVVPGVFRHGPVTFNVSDFSEETYTNYKRKEAITAEIGPDYNIYNASDVDDSEENLNDNMKKFMKDLYDYYRDDNNKVRDEEEKRIADQAAQSAADQAAQASAQFEEEKRLYQEAKDAADQAAQAAADQAAQAAADQEAERLVQEQSKMAEEERRSREEAEKNKILENANDKLKELKQQLETPLKSLIYAFKTKYMDPLISGATGINSTLTYGTDMGGLNKKVTNFIKLYNSYREKYFKIVKIYNQIEQITLTPGLTSIEEINNNLERIIGEIPEYVRKIEQLENEIQPTKSIVTYSREKSVKELFDELVKPSEDISNESFLHGIDKNTYIKNGKIIIPNDIVVDAKYDYRFNNHKKVIIKIVNFVLKNVTEQTPIVIPKSSVGTQQSPRKRDALSKLNTTSKNR